jgi:hypothetical protein
MLNTTKLIEDFESENPYEIINQDIETSSNITKDTESNIKSENIENIENIEDTEENIQTFTNSTNSSSHIELQLKYDELCNKYEKILLQHEDMLAEKNKLEKEISDLTIINTNLQYEIHNTLAVEKNKLENQILDLVVTNKNLQAEVDKACNIDIYINKLSEINKENEMLIEQQNASKQENKILTQKYFFVKNEYERLTNELFDIKVYNSNNKSLLEQNKILLEENTNLTNDLFNIKKELQILMQKTKFVDIEYKILSEHHRQYVIDNKQQIHNLKSTFGLNALNFDKNYSQNFNSCNIIENEERQSVDDDDEHNQSNENNESSDGNDGNKYNENNANSKSVLVTTKVQCLKEGDYYYKYKNGKKGKLYALHNSDGTVCLAKK